MVNIQTLHTDVNTANFSIIDMNFGNSKRKRKTAFGQIAKKWTCEKKENVKIKIPDFSKITFYLKAILIELIENDDSTRESKYIRNYMRPYFMNCQKMVLHEKMPME